MNESVAPALRMNRKTISFEDTHFFTSIILDYLKSDDRVKPLYKYPQVPEAFTQVIEDKAKANIQRDTLVEVLTEQYKDLKTSDLVRNNIEALRKGTTFTITTAHQPCIFTGPLYFIYKICSTIQLVNQLKTAYPDNEFVPVFWIGGEDHDFEEINHINLFHKTLEWQQDASGPVGRMRMNGIGELTGTLNEMVGSMPHGAELMEMLNEAYKEGHTLSYATLTLLDHLFRHQGLVVIDQDQKPFKKIFQPVIEAELFHEFSSDAMTKALQYLEKHYKVQAHARAINLFYMKDGLRERIIRKEDGSFTVNNTSISFSASEIRSEIEKHPECFSPNVILRPLYQQMILPNLAYIGGGGELAYWMELKGIFEARAVNYPMLILRDSALLLDDRTQQKLMKLNLDVDALFEETESLITEYVKNLTTEETELGNEKQKVRQLFEAVKDRAVRIDPTLEKSVGAELQKVMNSLENLEQKIIRAEKRNHETAVDQIRNLKGKLFPDNSLQERKENFIPFYAKYGKSFIDQLIEHFDPMEKRFKILTINAN